jgi:hypothetical protein
MIKLQIPSTKRQRSTKLQILKQTSSAFSLELGVWSFSGAWLVVIGAFPFGTRDLGLGVS